MEREAEVPFGARLRQLREAAGLSQEELAEAAGLARNAISALERGERRRPYPDTVRRLAEALQLDRETRTAFVGAVPSRGDKPAAEAGTVSPAEHGAATLPEFLTPLVGRESDLAALSALLSAESTPGTRLLTLTGSGGVGKTRLAIELARTIAPRFPDGVVLVPLAPLDDAALVLTSVAQSLELRDLGTAPVAEMLATRLQTRRLLLVLDNFEHVMAAAPDVARLLQRCPQLTVLVTSRAALRLQGEQEYPLAPLETPGTGTTAAQVGHSAAARLFVQRAQGILPTFALTDENAPAVAAICWRLDGLPLALELAAARVRLLPPVALQARLDRALPLLVGGARDLPARQRTMRDTIAWSYDLLTAPERAVFRRLAVFAGGCTVEAAEAVCRFSGEQIDVLPVLSSLLDQSLIRTEERERDARLTLLQTEREFGLEQLAESGEATGAHVRHAAFFRDLAQSAEPYLTSPERGAWLQQLASERDNLRAALIWSLGPTAEPETALSLAGALPWFWYLQGDIGEGRGWLERVLARWPAVPDAETREMDALRARVQWGLAALTWQQGIYGPARMHMEASIAAFRLSGERRRLALALHIQGRILLESGEPEIARASIEEALALYRAFQDRWSTAFTSQGLALVTWMLGEAAETQALFDEALALFRALGDQWGQAVTLFHLGSERWTADDLPAARAHLEQSIAIYKAIGNTWETSWALPSLGLVLVQQGDVRQATSIIAEGLRLCYELGHTVCTARALVGAASIAAGEGRIESAARLSSAAAPHLGPPRVEGRRFSRPAQRIFDLSDRLAATLLATLGEAQYARLRAQGLSLSIGDAVAEALATLEATRIAGPVR